MLVGRGLARQVLCVVEASKQIESIESIKTNRGYRPVSNYPIERGSHENFNEGRSFGISRGGGAVCHQSSFGGTK